MKGPEQCLLYFLFKIVTKSKSGDVTVCKHTPYRRYLARDFQKS